MDLSYLYYQCRYQYYRFLIYKLKFTAAWNKSNTSSKCLYCCSFCFGSVIAGWLLFKFLEKRQFISDSKIEVVDDLDDERILSKRRRNGVPPGLYNEGNTCFTNCVMQALASSPSFYKWTCIVLKHYGYSDITLFPSIHKLLKVLTNVSGNESNYSTGDVMSSVQSHGWVISREQQDAYEFFQVLVSTMEEELAKIAKLPSESLFDLKIKCTVTPSIYNKVSKHLPVLMNNELISPFKGSFASKLTCLTCGQQLPVKFEMFDSLILSLANISPFSATLYGCMDEWIKPELLYEVECNTCSLKFGSRYSTFSKQVSLAKLPLCFCIQLQRTTYSPFGTALKNTMYVQFPEFLDIHAYTYGNILSKEKQMFKKKGVPSGEGFSLPGGSKGYTGSDGCSSSPTIYNLNAVVVHFGGADGGHFITYRRVAHNNRWYHISDSFVKVIPKEHVFTSTAYLLFYEKVT